MNEFKNEPNYIVKKDRYGINHRLFNQITMSSLRVYFNIVFFMNLYRAKEIVAQGMKKSVIITNKTIGFIRWREALGGSQI